jgi:hypothetical protein
MSQCVSFLVSKKSFFKKKKSVGDYSRLREIFGSTGWTPPPSGVVGLIHESYSEAHTL